MRGLSRRRTRLLAAPSSWTLPGPFVSVAEAQAAVDAYVRHYNTDRPHQGLDVQAPVRPGTLNCVPARVEPGDANPSGTPVAAVLLLSTDG